VASGLIVVVPICVSIYAVAWVYWQLAKVPIPGEFEQGYIRVSIFLVMFSLVVLSVGYLMRTTVGRVVEEIIDDVANRVPLVRVVYNASKMGVETALTGTEELRKPVKVEPWNGMRLTAFKTGKTTEDGRDVLFMPTAPNITSGYVVEVRPEDHEEIDERVEDALTRILSAGFGESQTEKGIPIEVEERRDGERPPASDGGETDAE